VICRIPLRSQFLFESLFDTNKLRKHFSPATKPPVTLIPSLIINPGHSLKHVYCWYLEVPALLMIPLLYFNWLSATGGMTCGVQHLRMCLITMFTTHASDLALKYATGKTRTFQHESVKNNMPNLHSCGQPTQLGIF